jgi:hypothetical protein
VGDLSGSNRVLRYFRIRADRPVSWPPARRKGEEEFVFEAFQRIRASIPDALLILAPRKPEQWDDVERLARRGGWNVARRSELPVDAEPRQDVVLLDTIGELAQLYQVATVVFVGGSLVDTGGHNILEPAVFGKPIVFGPHMQNFAEIAQRFSTTAPPSRCGGPRAAVHAARPAGGSCAPREPRRRRARARRSQPRRPRPHARRHRRAAAAG